MEHEQMPASVDLAELSSTVTHAYWNEAIARVNDHELRLSVMTGAYDWHEHPDSDETFLVLEGQLVIGFQTGEVTLKAGQLLTVPRGTVHRTRAQGERSVNLTFEHRGTTTRFVTFE